MKIITAKHTRSLFITSGSESNVLKMPLPPVIDPRGFQSPNAVAELVGAIGKGLYKWAEGFVWRRLGLGYELIDMMRMGEWELTYVGNRHRRQMNDDRQNNYV